MIIPYKVEEVDSILRNYPNPYFAYIEMWFEGNSTKVYSFNTKSSKVYTVALDYMINNNVGGQFNITLYDDTVLEFVYDLSKFGNNIYFTYGIMDGYGKRVVSSTKNRGFASKYNESSSGRGSSVLVSGTTVGTELMQIKGNIPMLKKEIESAGLSYIDPTNMSLKPDTLVDYIKALLSVAGLEVVSDIPAFSLPDTKDVTGNTIVNYPKITVNDNIFNYINNLIHRCVIDGDKTIPNPYQLRFTRDNHKQVEFINPNKKDVDKNKIKRLDLIYGSSRSNLISYSVDVNTILGSNSNTVYHNVMPSSGEIGIKLIDGKDVVISERAGKEEKSHQSININGVDMDFYGDESSFNALSQLVSVYSQYCPKVTVEMLGVPSFEILQQVNLMIYRNVGSYLTPHFVSGVYYIENITDRISGGNFTTSLSLARVL